MKRIIFFFFLAATFAAYGQAPDYDVRILPEPGDSTYTLELIDLSNPDAEFESVNRRSGLTIAQVRNFFYTRYQQNLNKKGGQTASIYVTNRLLGQIADAITQAGGDYAAWSQNAVQQQGTLNGIYQYIDTGTGANVEVKIEGLEVRNNSNNNLLGNLTGELSEQLINIQVGVDIITLSGFSQQQFFGLRSGNIVVLTKKGELPEEQQP